jgi:hypothetical protein
MMQSWPRSCSTSADGSPRPMSQLVMAGEVLQQFGTNHHKWSSASSEADHRVALCNSDPAMPSALLRLVPREAAAVKKAHKDPSGPLIRPPPRSCSAAIDPNPWSR